MAMRSNPPLQPIEEYGRRFAQGQAVAFGGAGQLPGVGGQQHGDAGVVVGVAAGGTGQNAGGG
jgi:hypothetical protein